MEFIPVIHWFNKLIFEFLDVINFILPCLQVVKKFLLGHLIIFVSFQDFFFIFIIISILPHIIENNVNFGYLGL